jgi:hypothetical protein
MKTVVQQIYEDLVAKGMDQKNAAKVAQEKTGLSLVTGLPPKSKGYGVNYNGQYNQRPNR